MKIQSILFASLLYISVISQIEIPLYKSSLAYKEIKNRDAMIDDLDKTHFLVDLNLGTPSKSYPLQAQMAKEDIFIVNDKFKPKRDFLSSENSKSFKAEERKEGAYDYKAEDNICINDKNFLLKFQSSERILEEPLNEESSGILGLSLGDLEKQEKHKNSFPFQLEENKLTKNSVFYFNFDEIKIKPECKVPTLKDYLGIKGKIYIGDFPYNISPNQCDKSNIKTSQVLQIIKHDQIPMKDTSSLAIQFQMEKCIGCTACVKACSNIAGQNILECERKGKAHTQSGKPLSDTHCISCGQCSLACAKQAITEKFDI